MKSEAKIRAAGCVVYRYTNDEDRPAEVLVVHRPKHEDWSLPKGKLEQGESFEQAAVREVTEETGMIGSLEAELTPVEYEVNGKSKVVRYWLMEVAGGRFEPNSEVDEVKWCTPEEAAELLTYKADVRLLSEGICLLERLADGHDTREGASS